MDFPFFSPISHSIVRYKWRQGASLPPPWKARGFQGLLAAQVGGFGWDLSLCLYNSAQAVAWVTSSCQERRVHHSKDLSSIFFCPTLWTELSPQKRFYLLGNQTGLYSVQSHLYRAINYHFFFLPNSLFKELHCQGLSISGKTRVVPGLGYTHPYVSNPCSSLLVLSWNPVKAVSTRINTRENLGLPIMESRDVKTLLIIWLELQNEEF